MEIFKAFGKIDIVEKEEFILLQREAFFPRLK